MHTHIAENLQLRFRQLPKRNFPFRLFAVLDTNIFDVVKRAFGRIYLVFVLLLIAEPLDFHDRIVSRPRQNSFLSLGGQFLVRAFCIR